jgi:high-affinity nickel permease
MQRRRMAVGDCRLYYNLTITAVSVIVALIVGGLETLNLVGDRLRLAQPPDPAMGKL